MRRSSSPPARGTGAGASQGAGAPGSALGQGAGATGSALGQGAGATGTPSAFGQGADEGCLPDVIRKLTDRLLKIALPKWFVDGPTDNTARDAGAWDDEKEAWDGGERYDDWGNEAGSALLLVMLSPGNYGVKKLSTTRECF